MKRTLCVLFPAVILWSCAPKITEQVKKEFELFCYDGKSTGISSRININGYYRQRNLYRDEKTNTTSVVVHHFVFFEDGIFWSSIYDYEEGGGNRIDIDEFMKKLAANPNGEEAPLQRGSGYQGIYKISGDSIIAQYLNNPAPPNTYTVGRDWFRIVDRNTVQEVVPWPTPKVERQPATFVPVENMVKSNSWIQGEDWIYCNPADAPPKVRK